MPSQHIFGPKYIYYNLYYVTRNFITVSIVDFSDKWLLLESHRIGSSGRIGRFDEDKEDKIGCLFSESHSTLTPTSSSSCQKRQTP